MNTPEQNRFSDFADAYDRMCRYLVPRYDFFHDELLTLLADRELRPRLIVDLGAGSGILLERLLTAFPASRAIWVDSSSDFQRVALEKLGDARVSYLTTRLEDGWEAELDGKPDLIVSMSAIHHLNDREKERLYNRCREVLAPGGWFVNIDEIRPGRRDAYVAAMRFWVRHVTEAEQRIPAGELETYRAWCGKFEGWKKRNIEGIDREKQPGDDQHATAAAQLAMLERAGYEEADLFVKYHLWGLIGGRKPG